MRFQRVKKKIYNKKLNYTLYSKLTKHKENLNLVTYLPSTKWTSTRKKRDNGLVQIDDTGSIFKVFIYVIQVEISFCMHKE